MNMVAENIGAFARAVILTVRDLKGPWFLYDNEADPYQLGNLCDRPEVASVQTHLEGLLSDLLKEQNDTFATGQELLDQWRYEIVNPHAFRRIEE